MSESSLILLVEDNPDDYEATVRAFQKVNLVNPVHWSPSGQDALNYLRRKGKYSNNQSVVRPSLILLDLNMPGIDGRRVLEDLKGDRDLRSIPVVVMTTSNDPADVNRCYEMGASTYMQKPVGFSGLMEAGKRIQGYWFGVAILPPEVSERESC